MRRRLPCAPVEPGHVAVQLLCEAACLLLNTIRGALHLGLLGLLGEIALRLLASICHLAFAWLPERSAISFWLVPILNCSLNSILRGRLIL